MYKPSSMIISSMNSSTSGSHSISESASPDNIPSPIESKKLNKLQEQENKIIKTEEKIVNSKIIDEKNNNIAQEKSKIITTTTKKENLKDNNQENIPKTTIDSPKQKKIVIKQRIPRIVRKILLSKGPTGFGIAISEDRYNRLIVRGLNPNGVAFQDGKMQIGDEIIAVNDIKVNTVKYDDVMNLLHTTQEPVEFHVTKPDILSSSSAGNSVNVSGTTSPNSNKKNNKSISSLINNDKESSLYSISTTTVLTPNLNKSLILPIKKSQEEEESNETILNNPKTNDIRIGEETLIEIERGKLGLGMSIVGGSDTQLPGIIIHEIYSNGAAYRDKRLKMGDQILKVNNIDLINSTHEQALNALRQTSDTVKLLVHRGFYSVSNSKSTSKVHQTINNNPDTSLLLNNSKSQPVQLIETLSGVDSANSFGFSTEEHCLNIFSIDLYKKFGKGLGFSIIGRRDGSGVFISHIVNFFNFFNIFFNKY